MSLQSLEWNPSVHSVRNFAMLTLLLSALFLQIGTVKSSKILALMTTPSHSHHLWNSVYLEGLAERGHDITYVNVDDYPKRPDNIRHIKIENGYDGYGSTNFQELAAADVFSNIDMIKDWDLELTKNITTQPSFKILINIIKTEKFDLIVWDSAVSSFFLGLVDVLGKPPVIAITPFSAPPLSYVLTGSNYPLQNSPHFFITTMQSFCDRIYNTMAFFYNHFRNIQILEKQTALARDIFGKDIRSLEEIAEDVNIAMVNIHNGFDYPMALTPGLIPVGGLHIKPPKKLPEDIQRFLAAASNGAIYFSLGSNIRSSGLKKETLEAFIEAFERLQPIRVLWKFEDSLENLPPNVKISKWLPQNDILAHQHVVLFISHGGLLSTQEAIYHGKPIVGIPFLFDQITNVEKLENKGLAEKLNIKNLTSSETIFNVIYKVLTDKRYKERAEERSKIFRDNDISPLNRAIYWTEYAIKHNGAPHLRPASKGLYWFQNYYLDIVLLVAGFIISAVIVFSALLSLFGRRRKEKQH